MSILAMLCAVFASGAAAAATAESEGGNPSFVIGERLMLDDNLYRLPGSIDIADTPLGPGASRDDLISRTSASLVTKAAHGRQTFDLSATLAANRFSRNDSLNNTSATGELGWGWQVGSKGSGRFSAQYDRSLSSFANQQFLQRDLFETLEYNGELHYEVTPRWQLIGGARVVDGSHDNPARRNDDFIRRSGEAGIEYQSPNASRFGWMYRRTRQSNGALAVRDYEENTASFNMSYALSAKTYATASVGYLRRDYPSRSSDDFSGDIWNAELRWLPGAKTLLTVGAWRELRAYVDAQSDHFVARGNTVAAAWAPTGKLTVNLQLSRERQDYLGAQLSAPSGAPSRLDIVIAREVSVSYAPRPQLSLTLTWHAEVRDTSQLRFNYDDSAALLGIECRL